MKKTAKIISLMLAALMILSFVGCSAGMAENEQMKEGLNSSDKSWYYSSSDATYFPNSSGQDIVMDNTPNEVCTEEAAEEMTYGESDMDMSEGSKPIYTIPDFAENPFINAAYNNVSTFSADVDTASYTYFRRLVNSGYSLKELTNSGAAFRTEGFINYFKYNVAQPDKDQLFGVHTDIVPCPWNEETMLFRLTLQAEKAEAGLRNNLVFLIDVSGSMQSPDKLGLLKRSFAYLVSNLGEDDIISIVTYSGKEAVVLDGCQGSKSDMIMSAINSLNASGSTNGEAGLTTAYRIAEKHYIEGGNNRIIMASDGDLNVGISTAEELTKYIEQKRDQGVYLSVLGFGYGNYRDANMEALADNGNGVYYYIDGESEAEKVFGTDLFSTLYTVAEDVKLQLEFNPDAVESYRLIGYENRLLSKEDFDDDTKDAGEVGASHQVTVCYEIKLRSNEIAVNPFISLRVRYKNIGEPISLLNEYQITQDDMTSEADEDMRFIAAVIKTCMVLHKSKHLGDITINSIVDELASLDLEEYPEREEFRELVRELASFGYIPEEDTSDRPEDDSIVEMVTGEDYPIIDNTPEETSKIPVETWSAEDITQAENELDMDSDSGCVSEGRLYFHGSDAMLLTSNGLLMWLYENKGSNILSPFGTGDYVRVGHGFIMETYPAQTYISQIALIEDGDSSSLTDEEWDRLSDVIVGIERE